MKAVTAQLSVSVTIPTTAREWELYIGERGAGAAARALTAALRRLIKEAGRAKDDAGLLEAWRDFERVQNAWGHLGAADTEPRVVALETLAKAIGDDRVRRVLG